MVKIYHVCFCQQEKDQRLYRCSDAARGRCFWCNGSNNGKFSANEMREMMSILNVRILTTAAKSLFQNGLCERVHAVTDMMLLRLKEKNETTDKQTLLCWANMARSSLQMWNGFL